jgi:hypothetical protein
VARTTIAVPLFIVHHRAEAGFVTSIGFLIQSMSLVVATHPSGLIVLSGVVTIGITSSVTVLVSYAKLHTVMRPVLRCHAWMRRQSQA